MRTGEETTEHASKFHHTTSTNKKIVPKKYCTVNVDVDDLDCYIRAYNLGNSDPSDAIYAKSLARFLDIFNRLGIKATFFIVGKDMRIAANRDIVKQISQEGHEIASHTFSHQPKVSALSRAEQEREIAQGEEVLCKITGKPMYGYRGPGWDINEEIMDILVKRGYKYDSSLFPSLALPLSKLLLRFRNNGTFTAHGNSSYWNHLAPNQPYRPSLRRIWRRGDSRIIEFPITTVPFFRFPFFGGLLPVLGSKVFQMSFQLIKHLRIINYELHPIELVDVEADNIDKRLYHIHPGMKVPLAERTAMMEGALLEMGKYYSFLPYIDIVERDLV